MAASGYKSMGMDKTGMSAANATGAADTMAANANWLIDIDKTQEQQKIKFDDQGPEPEV